MGAENARLAPPGKRRTMISSLSQPTASRRRRASRRQAATARSASSGSSDTSSTAPSRSPRRFGPVSRRESRSFMGRRRVQQGGGTGEEGLQASPVPPDRNGYFTVTVTVPLDLRPLPSPIWYTKESVPTKPVAGV